jgi:hypothetical protein
MHLYFKNVPKRWNESDLRSAINFYADILFTKSVRKKLHIYFEFIHFGDRAEEEADIGRDSKYEYTICLSKNIKKKRILLELIAHEMTHAAQHVSGRLRDLSSSRSSFDGRSYNIDSMDYWDLPWEIEAYGKAVGLYARFERAMQDDTV